MRHLRTFAAAVALLALSGQAQAGAPGVAGIPIEFIEGQPAVMMTIPDIGAFRCILDTGSDSLVIPRWLMKQLMDLGMKFTVVGEGKGYVADGSAVTSWRIRLDKAIVGPWLFEPVSAVVVDDGKCLMGLSILRAFKKTVIDFGTNMLYLKD